jgi:hypothetical protein
VRSNCHLEAWRRYRRGEAAGFCFLPTRWSRLSRVLAHPLALPVRLLGAVLQWTCWPLTHVGEFLRSGHWYHVHWIDHEGRRWEFVPDAHRRARWAPPLVFRGRVRRVDDD